MDETPNFQPIEQLPLIAELIDGMTEDSEGFLVSLKQAETKPHVLDDHTVDRVIASYEERCAMDDVFVEQLSRWQKGTATEAERAEVERLVPVMQKLKTTNLKILTLAAQLRNGTIERVLEKDDLELAVDFLSEP